MIPQGVFEGFAEQCMRRGITKQAEVGALWKQALSMQDVMDAAGSLSPGARAGIGAGVGGLAGYGGGKLMGMKSPWKAGLGGAALGGLGGLSPEIIALLGGGGGDERVPDPLKATVDAEMARGQHSEAPDPELEGFPVGRAEGEDFTTPSGFQGQDPEENAVLKALYGR